MAQARQLPLFDDADLITRLDPRIWHSTSDRRRSTIHHVAPYRGRLHSELARSLVALYSAEGDVVLDPFAGSGVIPFEAVLSRRIAWAGDLNPYAAVLTLGKLQAPADSAGALARIEALAEAIEAPAAAVEIEAVPAWVRAFYHPDTLRQILAALEVLNTTEDYFLLAALLGIVHGPGQLDLSYPAGRFSPDVQRDKYPEADHPDRYACRPLIDGLRAHVERLYRRPLLPVHWPERDYRVWGTSALSLALDDASVDAVITNPPYFGALDYIRHNPLRLWFLGNDDLDLLAGSMTATRQVYFTQMGLVIKELFRVLKPGADCVLVVGDHERGGRKRRAAEILANLAEDATENRFVVKAIHDDYDLAARKANGHGVRYTRILVLNKRVS